MGLCRAGDQPCSGVTGVGTDGLWGLKWGPGPWAGWGEPQGVVRAAGALMDMTVILPPTPAGKLGSSFSLHPPLALLIKTCWHSSSSVPALLCYFCPVTFSTNSCISLPCFSCPLLPHFYPVMVLLSFISSSPTLGPCKQCQRKTLLDLQDQNKSTDDAYSAVGNLIFFFFFFYP